jgi:hypothetical protein
MALDGTRSKQSLWIGGSLGDVPQYWTWLKKKTQYVSDC